ncbi:MAG: LPS export ABC transporter periplasmic protein LptC [Methylotenera sp.]
MNINSRSAIIFPIVLLSILAILAAWINYIVQPPAPRLDGSSRHDPDYIVSNFVTTQTDINGNLRYKLAAAEMKHFPENDSTELQRPSYTQFAVGKPYTRVEGLRGDVSSNGEQVQLYDNVKVTRQAFAEKGEMTVETDYLNILPNQDLVRTDRPVVIRQAPKTVIYATGMIYEKEKHTVTLLHKVKAHYEKPGVKKTNAKKNKAQQPLAVNAPKETLLNKADASKNKPVPAASSHVKKPVDLNLSTKKPTPVKTVIVKPKATAPITKNLTPTKVSNAKPMAAKTVTKTSKTKPNTINASSSKARSTKLILAKTSATQPRASKLSNAKTNPKKPTETKPNKVKSKPLKTNTKIVRIRRSYE